MKIKRDLVSSKKALEDRKNFKIIYDGVDFGIYKFNQEKNRYEGCVGYIPIETMFRAIADNTYFIQAYEEELWN